MVNQENNENQIDQSNDNGCGHVDVCRSSIKLQAMQIKGWKYMVEFENKSDQFFFWKIPKKRKIVRMEREKDKKE